MPDTKAFADIFEIKAPFKMTVRLGTVEMLVFQGLMRGLSFEEMAGTYGVKPAEIDKAWCSLCARLDLQPPRPQEAPRVICRAFEVGLLITEAK